MSSFISISSTSEVYTLPLHSPLVVLPEPARCSTVPRTVFVSNVNLVPICLFLAKPADSFRKIKFVLLTYQLLVDLRYWLENYCILDFSHCVNKFLIPSSQLCHNSPHMPGLGFLLTYTFIVKKHELSCRWHIGTELPGIGSLVPVFRLFLILTYNLLLFLFLVLYCDGFSFHEQTISV